MNCIKNQKIMEKVREACEKKDPPLLNLKGPLVERAIKPKFTEEQQKALNAQLLKAAEEGNIKEVEELLTKGADVNAEDEYGWTALMRAVGGRETKIARMLIEKGADVNAKNGFGRTALMYAARNKDTEMVRMLIEKGADVNAEDKFGWTALRASMRAAKNEHTEMIEMLKKYEAKE
ncbi:MAG: ankyrin repeat domain-containing protein [Candidatus Bilamarchaeaceae archaeon]